ncbi:hypothetical protein EVAR_6019_1 [Eumeta japonica]|uniref:Uncharacterized protein n=1 Tax=Eumeta variegata TaxID=151549 RepID=A0A4C1TAL9_EUMVA|nr:hypothetical protein EVAR_6019_1 [Eumeta japonica]
MTSSLGCRMLLNLSTRSSQFTRGRAKTSAASGMWLSLISSGSKIDSLSLVPKLTVLTPGGRLSVGAYYHARLYCFSLNFLRGVERLPQAATRNVFEEKSKIYFRVFRIEVSEVALGASL